MRLLRTFVLLFAVLRLAAPPFLQGQNPSPVQAIRAVLDKQVVDWNRGDMEAFATGYKNSPDILFIGSKISRGYAQMLDTYRKGYSTKEKMGTLSFSELECSRWMNTSRLQPGIFIWNARQPAEATRTATFFSYLRRHRVDGRSFVTTRRFRQKKRATSLHMRLASPSIRCEALLH